MALVLAGFSCSLEGDLEPTPMISLLKDRMRSRLERRIVDRNPPPATGGDDEEPVATPGSALA